jgi:hypothetical protein
MRRVTNKTLYLFPFPKVRTVHGKGLRLCRLDGWMPILPLMLQFYCCTGSSIIPNKPWDWRSPVAFFFEIAQDLRKRSKR